MADEARTADDWERIARKLLVLGNYGFDTAGMEDRADEWGFLSDRWLLKWYGHPVEDYVQDELDAIDLRISVRPTIDQRINARAADGA